MPFFSVVVPVYNVERYLPECLASLDAQTFRDWECLCVDDGSKDGSGRLLDEAVRHDVRFRVVHQNNGGVASARNRALAMIRGRWLLFLDGDDVFLLQDVFASLMTILLGAGGGDMLFFGLRSATDFESPMNAVQPCTDLWLDARKRFSADVFRKGFYTAVYVAEVAKKIAFPPLCMGEDRVFFARYLQNVFRVMTLSSTYYGYRQRPGSAMSSALSRFKHRDDMRAHRMLLEIYEDGLCARLPEHELRETLRWVTVSCPVTIVKNRWFDKATLEEWGRLMAHVDRHATFLGLRFCRTKCPFLWLFGYGCAQFFIRCRSKLIDRLL